MLAISEQRKGHFCGKRKNKYIDKTYITATRKRQAG
jgi:hypothetical protein